MKIENLIKKTISQLYQSNIVIRELKKLLFILKANYKNNNPHYC
jgi:hypothetical protein